MVHTKIYVVECETPFFWYVGSTFRELYARIDEHEAKYGCKWTQRHGFRRMAMWADVPSYACSVLEDELTEWLMHEYGVHNVRGGNYVNCRDDCYAERGGSVDERTLQLRFVADPPPCSFPKSIFF